MLRSSDSWGPIRVQQMLEEHVAEHSALRGVLAGNDKVVAERMAAFGERLSAHIEREERTFLDPDVLRDDVVTVGPTS